MAIADLFSRIFRNGTTTLNDFEMRVVQAVANALPPEMRHPFERRCSAINLVQRLDGGREINCYSMRRGAAFLDESWRMLPDSGEVELAKFRVFGPAQTKNEGSIWVVGGVFFSIEFKDPTEHASASAIERVDVKI
jgi:hypothetical protein